MAPGKPLHETMAGRRHAVAVPEAPGPGGSCLAKTEGAIGAIPAFWFDPDSSFHAKASTATGAPENVDQIMLEYQRLSRLFLETQKRVMTSYLEASGGRRSSLEQGPKPLVATAAAGRTAGEASAGPAPQEVSAAGPTPPVAAAAESDGAQVMAATAGAAPGMDRQALTESLMKIVGERTGYPREMLDLNLDLEADLGIDSIKRMEILGHFLQGLFPPEAGGPPEELADLGGIKTLGEIIQRAAACLESACPKLTVAAPSAGLAMCSESPIPPEAQELLPRFTLAVIPAPEPTLNLRLAPGRVVMITDDGRGIAAALQQRLEQRCLTTALIRLDDREDAGAAGYRFTAGAPDSLNHVVEKIRLEQGPIGGPVHLSPLRAGIPYDQRADGLAGALVRGRWFAFPDPQSCRRILEWLRDAGWCQFPA
jgi:hypothetical protein